MRVWEIREGHDRDRYDRDDYRDSYRSNYRHEKTEDEIYDCGFEDGYEKAMKEIEGRSSYRRMR